MPFFVLPNVIIMKKCLLSYLSKNASKIQLYCFFFRKNCQKWLTRRWDDFPQIPAVYFLQFFLAITRRPFFLYKISCFFHPQKMSNCWFLFLAGNNNDTRQGVIFVFVSISCKTNLAIKLFLKLNKRIQERTTQAHKSSDARPRPFHTFSWSHQHKQPARPGPDHGKSVLPWAEEDKLSRIQHLLY